MSTMQMVDHRLSDRAEAMVRTLKESLPSQTDTQLEESLLIALALQTAILAEKELRKYELFPNRPSTATAGADRIFRQISEEFGYPAPEWYEPPFVDGGEGEGVSDELMGGEDDDDELEGQVASGTIPLPHEPRLDDTQLMPRVEPKLTDVAAGADARGPGREASA